MKDDEVEIDVPRLIGRVVATIQGMDDDRHMALAALRARIGAARIRQSWIAAQYPCTNRFLACILRGERRASAEVLARIARIIDRLT